MATGKHTKTRAGGTNTDWRGRKKKQAVFGVIKLFIGVAILGVIVGLGIVFKNQIMSLFEKKKVEAPPPAKVEPPPQKVTPPPEPKKVEPPPPEAPKVVEKKPEPKPERVVVDAEEKRAQELLAAGRKQMGMLIPHPQNELARIMDFGGAQKKFEEAASLKTEQETHEAAQKWLKIAKEGEIATRHIEISAFSYTDKAVEITMSNGNSMRGIERGADSSNYRIQTVSRENPASVGRSTFTIPRNEITGEPKVLSVADRQREFKDFLLRLESGLDLGSNAQATDFYDLVFLSKRLGLGPECAGYLERAADKLNGGSLADTFRNFVIKRFIDRASLQAAAGRKIQAEATLKEMLRTLPDYGVAKDEAEVFRVQVLSKLTDTFKSTIVMKKAEPPPPSTKQADNQPQITASTAVAEATGGGGDQLQGVDSSGVVGKGAGAALVDRANAAYEKGMKIYGSYQQGTKGNNNAVLNEACKYLDEAVDLYGQYLDKDPNNTAVQNRQVEANMIAYACRKYLTLR